MPVHLIGLSVALGACSMAPDAVITGGVPDDYRLRHPIAITEANRSIVVFVGHGRGGLTATRSATTSWAWRGPGFAKAPAPIVADVPVDTPNARAAS